MAPIGQLICQLKRKEGQVRVVVFDVAAFTVVDIIVVFSAILNIGAMKIGAMKIAGLSRMSLIMYTTALGWSCELLVLIR